MGIERGRILDEGCGLVSPLNIINKHAIDRCEHCGLQDMVEHVFLSTRESDN